jgi:hypothetical protein
MKHRLFLVGLAFLSLGCRSGATQAAAVQLSCLAFEAARCGSAQQPSADWNTPRHVVIGAEDSIMSFTASVSASYHCMPMAVPGELGNRVFSGCMEQQTGAAPGDFVFCDTTPVHRVFATGVTLGGTRARFDSLARVLTAHFGSPRRCPGRTGRLGNANYPPSLQWKPPGLTIQLRLGAPYAGADSVVEAQTAQYDLPCGDWIYGLGPA